MKTVAKINPEQEYESAKKLIEQASLKKLSKDSLTSLDSSVDNLMTVAKVLMEREDRRRGRSCSKKDYKKKGRQKGESRSDFKKLPSEKYPEIDVEEKVIKPDIPPVCPCCNKEMKESGLYDTAEKLEVIPKKYIIERHLRVKYNCGDCYGSMKNTPAIPSIIPTSNYGDSLVIDVALSKYSDLIPIERYASIAGRENLFDLPPQSLIGLTHHLANFLEKITEMIKEEILHSPVIMGDETPHRMLEGDAKKLWYLWGFFSKSGCYFEAHNTRSGEVVHNFLMKSQGQYFMSDGYTGYRKAIREIREKYNKKITPVLCNAHSYRYFKEIKDNWEEETRDIIIWYKNIFQLNSAENLDFSIRQKMMPHFEKIQNKCLELKDGIMPGSGLEKAVNYFLNHYDGLTECTKNPEIPLENNFSERNLRSPVVGRKTWLGTHSKRGAKTNANLFTIVQSCKVCNINPRNYLKWIVERIHKNEKVLTPYQYSMETQ